MLLTLFGSTQSASFHCSYYTTIWGTLGITYHCIVQNFVNITSLDAAQIDSISGPHLAVNNNDNVVAISVGQGQIHYFPRGLNKILRNLKGITFTNTGLKEIHQSDLKDFPKLVNLFLHHNNLEILEENLFEFNPNMEWINLGSNKISHIDPNVFARLNKLSYLYLNSNTCISMDGFNPTAVQDVIKTAKAKCINSSYSNLEQKVKNLINETVNLNSENLKLNLENLENEIKNSKYPKIFQERLQALRALLIEKEATTTITTIAPKESEMCIFKTCSALESKVNDVAENLKDLIALVSNQTAINKAIELINQNYEEQNKKFTNLMKALKNAFSTVPGV